MALFALSDLHLSFDSDKSMEVFPGWDNYTERIEKNWRRMITDGDTVVLAGDTSWAMGLENAKADFSFLQQLPGQKIISKGNHDYWWNTASKMSRFFSENGLDSLHILHNNAYAVGKFAVCGTRGWLYDGSGEQDEKVIARECGRLELSIAAAEKTALHPAVFLHYPPVYGQFLCEEILAVLEKHEIDTVYYGHIHGNGRYQAPKAYRNIKMRLISGDCVDFTPVFVG